MRDDLRPAQGDGGERMEAGAGTPGKTRLMKYLNSEFIEGIDTRAFRETSPYPWMNSSVMWSPE